MKPEKKKQARRRRRIRGTRKRIFGTPERPRLAVFRSLRHIYCQIVDDIAGKTLVAASSLMKDIRDATDGKKKNEVAALVGERIAALAQEKGISQVVFDRRHYRYHGRLKALAEGARKKGLKF